MFEENKTCPYTGLRPFSEEESLYFKGRDEHIEQATRQLGKNKFLILTGASGDGKSSLVYAGIVPNARAGFLKSSYSNWAVADFRPERNPFHNLCKSIAHQLGIPNVETVKSELSHGFSALADLYKASSLYYDDRDKAWLESDDQTKTVLKRKAANLLILADQFEEFFTNPENYQKGVPSVEATLVTNLLLETAQLALEENLPIYVVITMRSDFIGQCAAFRGLPEYIGFSQFFVPRLNRRQLQEVIEEPARFSGDRISRRLTERLIHDMVEGTDQLPILQHALNQIWKMAGDGKEEMDLIHYAMVGGMAGDSLPVDDAEKFGRWFQGLPEKIRNCYKNPDLQNVLNTHANKLFYQASDFIREKRSKEVSEEDSRQIIETAFKCLTKIDNGRAVRNRMTLTEITAILHQPNLSSGTVQGVLDVFREPGNTLLKPYISQDPETVDLKGDAVLDITHESLIRNWEHLGEWAAEEFNDYSTFKDFEQQLNRWIASGKSSSFLLYIGPLTYFESWFAKCKPNGAWIARYLEEEIDGVEKVRQADRTLSDSGEFLRRSAGKHRITRAVMRYGPRRIAVVLGLLAVVLFSSFTVKNYLNRRDGYVLGKVKEEILELAGHPNVALRNKTAAVVNELQLGQITLDEVVDAIPDPIEKINLMTAVGTNLSLFCMEGKDVSGEIARSFSLADSLQEKVFIPSRDLVALTAMVHETNDLAAALNLRYHNSRDPLIAGLISRTAQRAGRLVKYILEEKPVGFDATTELNVALENALNGAVFGDKAVEELITILSPFVRPAGGWLEKTYEKSKLEGRGSNSIYGPRFRGLYRELAYLYAARGNDEMALKCIDTLLVYNQNYHLKDFTGQPDNATNIAVYFYTYKHPEALSRFVAGYCRKKGMSEEEFYDRLVARSKTAFLSFATVESFSLFQDLYHNTNVEFGPDDQIKFFFERYREAVVRTVANPAARDFFLAVSYKNEALFYDKRMKEAGLKSDTPWMEQQFDKAFDFFHKVPSHYLEESMATFDFAARRKILFKFPDQFNWFHPWEPRGFYGMYTSDAFLRYVIEHGLLNEITGQADELHYFETWCTQYNVERAFTWVTGYEPIDQDLLKKAEKEILKNKQSKNIDLNMVHTHVATELFLGGHKEEAMEEVSRIQAGTLSSLLETDNLSQAPFSQLAKLAGELFKVNESVRAFELLRSLSSPVNRAVMYAYCVRELAYAGSTDPLLSTLLDSCRMEINRDETRNNNPRVQLAYSLTLLGGEANLQEASHTMKNAEFKSPGMERMCRAMSYKGDLYEAWQSIPQEISESNRAICLAEIAYGRTLAQKNNSAFWKRYEEGRWMWLSEFLFYNVGF